MEAEKEGEPGADAEVEERVSERGRAHEVIPRDARTQRHRHIQHIARRQQQRRRRQEA